nr:hypothetical protein [Tanacetum cinerariifolium]
MITNGWNAILRELDIDHPTVKLMIELSHLRMRKLVTKLVIVLGTRGFGHLGTRCEGELKKKESEKIFKVRRFILKVMGMEMRTKHADAYPTKKKKMRTKKKDFTHLYISLLISSCYREGLPGLENSYERIVERKTLPRNTRSSITLLERSNRLFKRHRGQSLATFRSLQQGKHHIHSANPS